MTDRGLSRREGYRETKLRANYDWIVVGDHFSAILSAALAAKLGLSVLVLALENSPSLSVSRFGQVLEWEDNFFPGLGAASLGGAIFRYLGATTNELDAFQIGTARTAFVSASNRIVFTGADALSSFRELNVALGLSVADSTLRDLEIQTRSAWLQLPEDATVAPAASKGSKPVHSKVPVQAKLSDLQKLGGRFFSDTAIGRRISRQPGRDSLLGVCVGNFSRDQLSLMKSIARVYGGVADSDPRLWNFSHGLGLLTSTVSYRHGASAAREWLLRLAARCGAHVANHIDCRRIFLRGNRFTGVQAGTRGVLISGRGLVLGCASEQGLLKIDSGSRVWQRLQLRRTQKFPKTEGLLTPVGWKLTVAATFAGPSNSPPRLRRYVLHGEGGPDVTVEFASASDYPISERDRWIVFLRTTVPWRDETLMPSYLRQHTEMMWQLFSERFPFLNSNRLRIFPDFDHHSTTVGAAYPYHALIDIPEALRVYGTATKSIRPDSLGLEGLFVANGEVFSEWGTLGGVRAALESVAWLAHQSGLPGPISDLSFFERQKDSHS